MKELLTKGIGLLLVSGGITLIILSLYWFHVAVEM